MFDDKQLNETYPTLAKYTEGVKTAEREIVGRDYEINQLMAALNRPELCNALLLAPPGSGKALANGTLIPVADARGYVPIEKLVAGKDRVFDEQGEPQDVEGVFPQGPKRAFRLVLEDGSALVLNDEHLQNARRGGEAQDLVEAFEAARAAQEENPTPETLVAMRDAARELWAAHTTVTVRDILDSPDGSDWFVPSGFGVERGLTSEALVEHLSDNRRDHTATQAIEEAAMLRLADRARFVMNSVSPDGRTGWLFTHDRDFAEAVRRTLASAGTRCDVGSFVDSHGHGYRVRPRKHWAAELRVVSITDLGHDEEMTCIKVSGESSLFQAGRDHVVTHNTALVQAAALTDTDRVYMEVDLAKMISGLTSSDEMAPLIKQLFDEAEEYSKGEKAQLVLFLDEFHQIVQLSPAAVEALKPVLAASGARGIRVIAATTDEEFDKWIKPNQPLVERLQRIIVNPPDKATTIKILRGMAKRYEVEDHFYDDHLFETIHEYTERYMPASTQPRKSILVLDSMVGWHRHTGRDIDRSLLADVLMESLGVNVAFRVDAARIKEDLDSKVYSQHWATEQVAKRLQLCVADLHDKSKPTSSFLFTGSTGVGKTELTKQLAHLLFGDATKHFIRFDMTEYALEDSLATFRHELTSRVWHTSHAVLLFDEIEKAHAVVTRMLLQVLDDGRLSDANGRQVSFLNTYIVLTTNAASEIYETVAQYSADDEGSGEAMKGRMKEIRRSLTSTTGGNKFPPELLGRIDVIVPFQPLSRETQNKIVARKMRQLRQEVMTKHGIKVIFDSRVLTYLVEDKADTDSNAGGARVAIARLTEDVSTAVATFINAHPDVRTIQVDIDGELVSENKDRLAHEAKVRVSVPRD